MKLSAEQQNIVKNQNPGVHLVRGTAGSGKTTVGILKSIYLANNLCEKKDKMIFITYNKLLSNLVSDKLNKYNSYLKTPVEIKNIDKIIYHCYSNTVESKQYKIERSTNILLKQVRRAISMLSNGMDIETKKIINNKNAYFILDEINYINANMYSQKEYMTIQRSGRGKQSNNIKSIKKHSITRQKIYQVKELYAKLLKENGLIDFYEMSIIALKHLKTHQFKPYYQRYKHILIDEFQDLNKIQIEFIKNMLMVDGHSTFTIICDVSQIIYPFSYISYNTFKSIGINVIGRSKVLSKNYRTTKQIAKAANCLIENNELIQSNDLYVKVEDVVNDGPYPVKRHFNNFTDEINYVSETINKLVKDGYKPSDIAITAKQNDMLETISKFLKVKSKIINDTVNKDISKVNIITFHKIKGTEYKVVFILGLNHSIIPGQCYNDLDYEQHIAMSKMLLYVAMTRAQELLFLLSSDINHCEFIDEIDQDYLTFQYKCQLKAPYLVNPDNYKFKNKLHGIYNPEEFLRQWLIDQLITQYGYKIFQLSIEEPVQIFSQSGFVDIAIKLDGKIVLIIEVKKYECKLTETEIQQLQSYMQASRTCMYGVLTNGQEIIIYDSKYEQIDDIPTLKQLNEEIDTSPKSLKVINIATKRKMHKENKPVIQNNYTIKNTIEKKLIASEPQAKLNINKASKNIEDKKQKPQENNKMAILKRLKNSSISQKIKKEGTQMQTKNMDNISYYIFTNAKDTIKSFVYLDEYKTKGTITYKKQRSNTELIEKQDIKKVPILEYVPENEENFTPTNPLQKIPFIDQIAEVSNSMILQANDFLKDEEKIIDQEHTDYIIIKVGEPQDNSDVIAIIGSDKNIHIKVWGSFKDSEESEMGTSKLIGILIGTIEVF